MKTKIIDFNSIDISKVEIGEELKIKSKVELIAPTIINAIVGYANQQRGLFKSERTLYFSVIPSLEDAVKNKVESLEITDEECGFIKKCFRDAKLPPTSMIEAVEKYIDNLER